MDAKVVQIERNTKQKFIFFVFISEMPPTFDEVKVGISEKNKRKKQINFLIDA